MKKKIYQVSIAILLCITLLFTLSSCEMKEKPRAMLQNLFTAIKADDTKTVKKYLGIERVFQVAKESSEELQWLDDSEMYKAIFAHLAVNIESVTVDDDIASVLLTMDVKDIRFVLEQTMQTYEANQRNPEKASISIQDIFKQQLENANVPVVKKSLSLELTAIDNAWQIYNVQAFSEAITNGLSNKEEKNIGKYILLDEKGVYMQNIDNVYQLWYNQSAKDSYKGWENESLPIGNGKIGATIFGGETHERIQFNEKTLWSGGLDVEGATGGNAKNTNGEALKRIQDYLEEGKTKQATKEMKNLLGDEIGLGAYQSFGNIYLDFPKNDISNYTRRLNLNNATASVKYTLGQQKINREYFISYPDNVLGIKISSDNGALLSFDIAMDNTQGGTVEIADNHIQMYGNVTGMVDGKKSENENNLQWGAYLAVQNNKGNVTAQDNKLSIKDAESVVVFMSAATNYKNEYPTYRSDVKPLEVAQQNVTNAQTKGYDKVYQDHVNDYGQLFNRMKINVGQEVQLKPTDIALKEYQKGRINTALEMLYFQYGRYLLIASSRDGSLPANLQGIWNDKNDPAWQSDYHLNVNLQMNYWPAYTTNLAETAVPLLDYVESLRVPGRKTAKYYTGIGELLENGEVDVSKPTGWMAHTQNNPLGNTGPGSNWHWGWSPTAGAWLTQNTYDYYRFTQDIDMLENTIYPAMEEAALMWSQLLIEEKGTNRLVSSPTYSPEHGPITAGNTYDQSLIWELYTMVIEAAKSLEKSGRDKAVNKQLIAKIEEQLPRLEPVQVGEKGQIKEWVAEDDWFMDGRIGKRVKKKHRHLSHLLGLYPGTLITQDNQEWMTAARVSLEGRGDKGTGWSKAQKIAAWARLRDGNQSHFMLEQLLKESTLENLWDTHPPFQIDGNFGATAGITEMFVQSHAGYIDLLPALPDQWGTGSVKGIMARGGFQLDIEFVEKEVKSCTIFSKSGGLCSVEGMGNAIVKNANGEPVSKTVEPNGRISFETQAGQIYLLSV